MEETTTVVTPEEPSSPGSPGTQGTLRSLGRSGSLKKKRTLSLRKGEKKNEDKGDEEREAAKFTCKCAGCRA